MRTEWSGSDIWMRREFTLPAGKITNPQLLIHHDEDAEIYINGVLAAKVAEFTTDYEVMEINAAGKAALKQGLNTLAVHCHQTRGGQYIDVGIVDIQ